MDKIRGTIAWLLLWLLFAVPVSAIDAPHNEANGVACPACHGPARVSSPFWGGEHTGEDLNSFCYLNCHDQNDPNGYTPQNAPYVRTHSSAVSGSDRYGTWGWLCTDCHDQHNHEQNNHEWRRYYGEEVYLAAGTWDSTAYGGAGYRDNGDGTSTLSYDSLSCSSGWDLDLLQNKSRANRRAILLPNYRRPAANFVIAGITGSCGGAGTITVNGDAGSVPRLTRYGFRVIYGQYIRQHIDHDADTSTPSRQVKFLSSNDFVEPEDSGPATGICQVCHTRTGHWSPAAPEEDIHYPGERCVRCHRHEDGFVHGGGSAGSGCAECHGHDPGYEYEPGKFSAGHGSITSHSAHTEHDGDDVNGPDVECGTCHAPGHYPYFKSGTDTDGDGRFNLAETDTCDACHHDATAESTGTVNPVGPPAWETDIDCSGCHDYGPAYANTLPKANSHAAHAGHSCEKCHYATTTDGANISDISRHINYDDTDGDYLDGTYDLQAGPGASFTYVYNASGGSCLSISCHNNTNAQWGDSACLGCHATYLGNREAVAAQFTGGVSHHVQDVEVEGGHCYQCHWEANSDGGINLTYHGGSTAPASPVDLVLQGVEARPTTYEAGVTATTYTAANRGGGLAAERAETAKITPHCISCHRSENNGYEPFGDCRTPRQYAWDWTGIKDRYGVTGTTTWGKYDSITYNANAKDTITKALSAHGNAVANQGGYNETTGIDEAIPDTRTGAAYNYNVHCFDCHNSHGSSVPGITTSYASFTGEQNGGLLKQTKSGKGGYALNYTPTADPGHAVSPYNSGAGLCFDCHENATAGASTPWGYATYGATAPVIGYKDNPRFYGSYPGKTVSKQYTADQQSQIDLSFRSARSTMGGHFKASHNLAIDDSRRPAGYTTTSLSTQVKGRIDGLCTPCHDPHGVSPTLGADRGYGVPLLKGTYLSSPYKEAHPTNLPYGATAGGYDPDHNVYHSYGDTHTSGNPSVDPPAYYSLDRTMFGDTSNFTRIDEDAALFAGLCLRCHPRLNEDGSGNLEDGRIKNTPFRSVDRIHEAVAGWGQNREHSFPCSKCHQPHASGLPRLMKMNCLDFNHRGGAVQAVVPPSMADFWAFRLINGWQGEQHTGFPRASTLPDTRQYEANVACHIQAPMNDKVDYWRNQGWYPPAGPNDPARNNNYWYQDTDWPDAHLWNAVTPW